MKIEWKQPLLEVLDINQTMRGFPNQVQDDWDGDEAMHGPSRIVAMSFCEPRSCIGRLSS